MCLSLSASIAGSVLLVPQMCDSRLCSEETDGLCVCHFQSTHLMDLMCIQRSHFSEDFKDAEGFGWELTPPQTHNWKKLVGSKVPECC